MLLRTEKLVFEFFSKQIFLKNGFCHAKPFIQNLHLKKQTAELSLEIYHLILRKPDFLDLERKSLHDMIMEKIYQKNKNKDQNITNQFKDVLIDNKDSETFKYHKQARKPFIDLFEKGYLIDTEIFGQQRFDTGKIETNRYKKFIFHPTYLITTQVFQELDMLFNGKKIVTGHFGISKTVSVCLFWHLAKFIDEYRYQEGVIASKQMMRVPKLVYWSISPNINSSSNDFKNMILYQCPQILKKLNINDTTHFNWNNFYLFEFYSKYFPESIVIIVIDQINQIAQLERVKQKYIVDTQNIRLVDDDQQKKKIQNNVSLFFKLKNNIEFCIIQFDGVLGISYMDIQRKFFEKQIVFSTSTNSLIPPISWVRYSSIFYKPQSLAQIVDYFIFQMNQRIFKNLKKIKVSQQNQKEIKKICLDYLKQRVQKKEYFFFTPLDIASQVIQFIKIQGISTYDQPINKLKQMVKNKLQQFASNSLQTYKKSLQEHLDKKGPKIDNQKRIKIMFTIYNYLAYNFDRKNQQSKMIQINSIPSYIFKFSSEQIQQFLDKRLFQYVKSTKVIRLMLPPTLIVDIIKPTLKKYNRIYVQSTLQSIQKFKDKSVIGKQLEFSFIQTLNMGNIKFSFNLKNLQKQGEIYKYEFEIKDEIFTFQQLYKTTKTPISSPVSLLDRFKQTINDLIKQNKNYAVLLPVSKNFQKDQSQQKFMPGGLAKNSKCIDLAFIQNIKSFNLIRIWLIDLTVSQSLIRPKIYDFLTQFLNCSDKNTSYLSGIKGQPKVQIHYAVFGPENDIKHNDLKNVLVTNYGKSLTFTTIKGSNAFTVANKKKKQNCLLKRIAYIDLSSDFKFQETNKQENKHLELFNELSKKYLKKKIF